jgi:16S rRNA (guanine966-N2)-methyltransferase
MTDAGRVIAGSARGVRLIAPGDVTRPFSDRVKQALFAVLQPGLPNAMVLDLFAGSGAGGIEALSRGALHATFVEQDHRAVVVIQRNLDRAGLIGRGKVIRADALDFLSRFTEIEYDLVLLDPPYDRPELAEGALVALGQDDPRWLADDARVVVKHFWRDAPPAKVGLLASQRERRFGETALTFYRRLESA